MLCAATLAMTSDIYPVFGTPQGTGVTPGDWIIDAEAGTDPALANPAISGPEVTHVAIAPKS